MKNVCPESHDLKMADSDILLQTVCSNQNFLTFPGWLVLPCVLTVIKNKYLLKIAVKEVVFFFFPMIKTTLQQNFPGCG